MEFRADWLTMQESILACISWIRIEEVLLSQTNFSCSVFEMSGNEYIYFPLINSWLILLMSDLFIPIVL